MKAVFTGTFDPITNGHIDIIERAVKLFGSCTVAVADNIDKRCLIGTDDRVMLVKSIFAGRTDVEVIKITGIASDYVKSTGGIIVRGVRSSNDFEYEKTLYSINRELNGTETVFLPSKPELDYISSTFVRDIFANGKDITPYVPHEVADFFEKCLR